VTTAAPSAALATIQPVFTDAERVALAGFLAGYRGLTREAYALDLRQFASWCRSRSLALFTVRRADIEGFAGDLEAMGRARAAVIRRLPAIAGSASTPSKRNSWIAYRRAPPPTASRLRVSCGRAGPLRTRRPPGGSRARPSSRARADLATRAERASRIGGHRRRHRAPGPRARTPDPDHHPQGRQGRLHPARAAHRPGDRPGHRRTHRRAGVPSQGRPAAGPARCWPDRPHDRS